MSSKLLISIVIPTTAVIALACGGGDGAAVPTQVAATRAPVPDATPTRTPTVDLAGGGSQETVPSSNPADTSPTATPAGGNTSDLTGKGELNQMVKPILAVVTPTATATGAQATPTATARARTLQEAGTGKLVDELSEEDFPRFTAREIVGDYRSDAVAAEAQHKGQPHLIKGAVREAGRDPDGTGWVIFNAGRGSLKCIFSDITDDALLRLSPAGQNATTGTPTEWDPETLTVTVTDCLVVKGF